MKVKERYMDEEMDNAEMMRFFAEYQAEQYYEECQRDLPPHKRDGYAEQMAEEADMRRKALREEFK